jgi:predicted nucleotidyltransferase
LRWQRGENEEESGPVMKKENVLSKLREHEPELRAAGLVHLRLFGSVARGDATSESDVDLLADFDTSKPVTLVTIGSLESRLGDLLGSRVELSSTDWLREPIRLQALREALVAF